MLSTPIASLEAMTIKQREKNSTIEHPSFEENEMMTSYDAELLHYL